MLAPGPLISVISNSAIVAFRIVPTDPGFLPLFVYLLFISRYMEPKGPWQRLTTALSDNDGLSSLTFSYPGPARVVVRGVPNLYPHPLKI